MQLNEILEENSVKAISKKTNISENNLEALINDDFSELKRAKALGFISIIERDYDADLKTLKEKALVYYDAHSENDRISVGLPMDEEKRGRSIWVLLLVLGLLAYATWYFFTQFDQKTLTTLLPFQDDKTQELTSLKDDSMLNEATVEKDLSISEALSSVPKNDTFVKKDIVLTSMETEKKTEVTDVNTTVEDVAGSVKLVPQHRLWFGLVEMGTGERDHFSISKPYEIDVKEKSWLLATSTAAFSFIYKKETQEYNDSKEHYFKVSKEGVVHLSREEYIAQGGWQKW